MQLEKRVTKLEGFKGRFPYHDYNVLLMTGCMQWDDLSAREKLAMAEHDKIMIEWFKEKGIYNEPAGK